jgi:carboxymethylenebutenolidase
MDRSVGKFAATREIGHSFFAVDRPSYRSEQATDAWRKVFAWYDNHLS